MSLVNYYELLGVEKTADEGAIKEAIRKTRKRFRQLEGAPDMNQRQMAETKMTQIAEAEKTLLDASARQEYDKQLEQASAQPESNPQPQSNGPSTSFLDDAKSYYRNGQLRNASYAAKEATRNEKDNPEAWYVRALISLEQNDYADADFSANQALQLNSQNAAIFGVLGDVADRESRYQDAEKYFRGAAKLEPDNYYWAGRVVWALSDQKRFDEALTEVKTLFAKYPNEPYVKTTYINLLLNDIENAASQQDGMYYFTNKKQIEYARNRIQQIERIGVPSENKDLVQNVEEHRKAIEQAARRKFIWQGLGYYVIRFVAWLIIFVVLAPMMDNQQVGASVALLLITVLLIWRQVEKTFPYQWKVNAIALGDDAKTGLQK